MPATTKDSMMAGPASWAATRPVITKIPEPMMAPLPSEVSEIGPRTRRRRLSPSASARSVSRDFLANSCLKNMGIPLGVVSWRIDNQSHRPVVDQLDAHHGPEAPRLHRQAAGAHRVDERLVQRHRDLGTGGADETRPAPPAAVAGQREPAPHPTRAAHVPPPEVP